MNKDLISKIFPNEMDNIKQNKCPTCGNDYKGFKDDLSLEEYKISGMCQECQECQDSVFGAPVLDNGLPTGKCPNCGKMTYNNDDLCSEKCIKEFTEYLNKEI